MPRSGLFGHGARVRGGLTIRQARDEESAPDGRSDARLIGNHLSDLAGLRAPGPAGSARQS